LALTTSSTLAGDGINNILSSFFNNGLAKESEDDIYCNINNAPESEEVKAWKSKRARMQKPHFMRLGNLDRNSFPIGTPLEDLQGPKARLA